MLKIKVNAKVNLSLDITGKREDGYHELDMVMTSISIADTITFEPREDSEIVVKYINHEPYQNDIAIKAGEMLVSRYGFKGANILIDKCIPEKSGLGGSSADASGVIFGLSKLNNYNVDDIETDDILSIGSDVLYMLSGGTRRIFGTGDIVSTKIEILPMYFVILVDKIGVDTAESYKTYHYGYNRFDNKSLIKALIKGDNAKACTYFNNALYDSSKLLNSHIDEKIELLQSAGANSVFMTGSGSGVVGYFSDKKSAKNAEIKLKQDIHGKFDIFYAINCDKGIEI